jgi:two-component system, OmpR family, sensor histidine kinase BaeS
VRQRLLWKLLIGTTLPVIAVIVLLVWFAVDQLAADYFAVLMKQYHIDPVDSHRMFLTAIHRYLIWASLAALTLALFLNYLLTRKVLRPLFQMTDITRQVSTGNYTERVDVVSSDEVGQLARSFNQMADSLEKIEKLRKNMVADIAHELRTPLTNIRGCMEAMSDGVIPASRETFTILENESMRLVRLIEDLQQLARADAARAYLDRKEISLHVLLHQIVDLYLFNFQEKEIPVEWHLEPGSELVDADRDKLLQAIRNLVDNAWKYTPAHGTVTISTFRTDDGIKTVVANCCGGIDEKNLPFIFERFFRAERSRSRDDGGAGIGLAIVKELIEAHGGQVGAESDNAWTRVWFTLPSPKHSLP